MKIWVFVEGDSEENMVRSLLHRHFPNFHIESDESYFVELMTNTGEYWVRIVNCESVDRIPGEIDDSYRRIVKSQADKILIISDVEKSIACPSERINRVFFCLEEDYSNHDFVFVLSCPVIEAIYFDHPNTLKSTVKNLVRVKFPSRPSANISIAGNNSRDKYAMKTLCNNHDIKYREGIFSEGFFGRLNYSTSPNTTIQRLFHYFDSL